MTYSYKQFFRQIYESAPPKYACTATDAASFLIWKNKSRDRLRELLGLSRLEQFIADFDTKMNLSREMLPQKTRGRVAVIGSGPAGLTVAGDLARQGFNVTIFEGQAEPGGVLMYGIPEYRLPKSVVRDEVAKIAALGVQFITNCMVGENNVTIDSLFRAGYDAIFMGTGTNVPQNMDSTPGSKLHGVSQSTYFLHNVNAYNEGALTRDMVPLRDGEKVGVIGGGNVAMDAARTALRLGAKVHVVYRRSEAELPARVEEVHHAKEEGIIFNLLTNPVEILTDDNGWVKGMVVRKMELGEPDASGRRRPVEIPGSDYTIDVDAVIMSLGTSPNPLISSTTEGLETNRWKCIIADEANGKTTKEGVYAGGDAVTGAATVILAMEAGRAGARGIDEFLQGK